MSNQSNMSLKLKGTANRALVITAFPSGKPVNFAVYYHKTNSGLTFDVNSKSNILQNRDVKVFMYRNLNNCPFCTTFFNLESIKNNHIDYQNKFAGVSRAYERCVFSFLKEKLDLQAPDYQDKQNNKSSNYLLVLGWKIHGIEDDLIFYFVQRKFYNNISGCNIIRSAGLQFATQRGSDTLIKYQKECDESIRKVRGNNKFESIFT